AALRHRLANVALAYEGEGEVRPPDTRLPGPTALGGRASKGDGLAAAADVLARHHLEHARSPRRRGPVDLADLGVRMWASHKGHEVETGNVEIADIGRGARDEARIFLALDLRAHQSWSRRGHGGFPFVCGLSRIDASARRCKTSARLVAPVPREAHHEPRQHGETGERGERDAHAPRRLSKGALAGEGLASRPTRVDVHGGGGRHEDERREDIGHEPDAREAEGVVEQVEGNHGRQAREGYELPAAP